MGFDEPVDTVLTGNWNNQNNGWHSFCFLENPNVNPNATNLSISSENKDDKFITTLNFDFLAKDPSLNKFLAWVSNTPINNR